MHLDRPLELHAVMKPDTDRDALRRRALALIGCGEPLSEDVARYLIALVEGDTPADARRAERDRLLREAGHWIGGSLTYRADEILRLDALEERRPVSLVGRACTEPRHLVALARRHEAIPSRRQLLRILAEGGAYHILE
jgi:hypothetical protein